MESDKDKALSYTRMETDMKAVGIMIRKKAKAKCITKMEIYILEIGKRE